MDALARLRACQGPCAPEEPRGPGAEAVPEAAACWRPCPEAACGLGCTRSEGATLDDVGHTAPADPVSVPAPAASLLAHGGEAGLRRVVHRHMQRLRWTALMAGWHGCFDCVGERVADFLVETCGGPRYYSERHALRRGEALGPPLRLTREGREIWLVQLWHACDDVGWPELLRRDLWRWAEPFSVQLLSAPVGAGLPRRYPYERVAAWFELPDSIDPAIRLH